MDILSEGTWTSILRLNSDSNFLGCFCETIFFCCSSGLKQLYSSCSSITGFFLSDIYVDWGLLLLCSSSGFELIVWILGKNKTNIFVYFETLPRDIDKLCAATATELY